MIIEIEMHKTKIIKSLMFFMILSVVYGCAPKPVAKELVNYINQDVLSIAELEEIALTSYASVSGENYQSDQLFYQTLKINVLPVYKRFVSLLHEIDPQSEPVRNLHAIYSRAAETRLRGFETVMIGLYNRDIEMIHAANKMLAKGEEETERWRNELKKMYESYDIVADKSKLYFPF